MRQKPPPLNVILIRHAHYEPSGLSRSGRLDGSLSELGEAQAAALAERLANIEVDQLYHSGLERAVQTAAAIAAEHDALSVTEQPLLAEVHRGEFEDLERLADERIERVFNNGRWMEWPGGETRTGFQRRVMSGFGRIVDSGRESSHQRTIAIVAHGGTIVEIVSNLTGSQTGAFGHVINSALAVVTRESDCWTLQSFNDAHHLEDSLTVM